MIRSLIVRLSALTAVPEKVYIYRMSKEGDIRYNLNKEKVRGMNSKIVAISIAFALAAAMPVMAGGYEGVLETYTLTNLEDAPIMVYERPDMWSPVIRSIPSGTEVKIIKGNPEGWMLIEYEGVQGCVLDHGLKILCTGVREPSSG